MLANSIKYVFIAQHRIDFRKRFCGLLAEAKALELDIYSGECLVFIHPSKRQLRIIWGDKFGVYLLERFFEEGKLEQEFRFMSDPAICEITVAELAMMLDGNAFIVKKRAKKWR